MLGHRIQLLRSQKGLSQAELARKLHVQRKHHRNV